MRVKKYVGRSYHQSTGSSHEKVYEFTLDCDRSMAVVFHEDGIDIEVAERLLAKWNGLGDCKSIKYTYRLTVEDQLRKIDARKKYEL